jgi:small-conductance mechanosensitive channel
MNFDFSKYFNVENFERLIRITIILVIGLIITYTAVYLVKKFLPSRWSRQRKMIVSRFVQYSGLTILFLILVAELKINLGAIFGAAGIIGIVLGVASQTSIGNIVSGFFLVSEKSFELGDIIKIGDKTGTVYSIDLLSIKIKTFDNLLIRVPNQTVISSEVTNVTRFPIRRIDLEVGVAYKEDLGKVKNILERVARQNPLSLDEPEPLIAFQRFGSSSIDILFGIWVEKDNYLKVKNSLFKEIKLAFEEEGIEIPFPHVSIYTGEATKPFPVTSRKKES